MIPAATINMELHVTWPYFTLTCMRSDFCVTRTPTAINTPEHFHIRMHCLQLKRKLEFKMAVLSEVLSASIITHRPHDGDSKHLWNVGKLLPDYAAQQPTRQPSSYSPPWDPEMSQTSSFFRCNKLLNNAPEEYLRRSKHFRIEINII
jgi:hypothetical protein